MTPINEKQLQAQIYQTLRNNIPNSKGLVWSVANRTLSVKDGIAQKATGLTKSVSDLMCYFDGVLYGLEVKHPEKRHSIDHIRQQLEWGEKIVDQGGKWAIVTTPREALNFVVGLQIPYYNVYNLRTIINEHNGKTITFPTKTRAKDE